MRSRARATDGVIPQCPLSSREAVLRLTPNWVVKWPTLQPSASRLRRRLTDGCEGLRKVMALPSGSPPSPHLRLRHLQIERLDANWRTLVYSRSHAGYRPVGAAATRARFMCAGLWAASRSSNRSEMRFNMSGGKRRASLRSQNRLRALFLKRTTCALYHASAHWLLLRRSEGMPLENRRCRHRVQRWHRIPGAGCGGLSPYGRGGARSS